MRKEIVSAAIKRLRADPDNTVVKVQWRAPAPPGTRRRKTNGAFPYWDRIRAPGAGLEILPEAQRMSTRPMGAGLPSTVF